MFTTANTAALRRSEVWSAQLKDVLQDELMGTGYVRWLTEFPDGDTFTIPSIGASVNVRDYVEDQAVVYDAMDTGEFQFSITEYLSSATYITKKAMQDGYYMSELVASFVPKQSRAIMEHVETSILGLETQQTASDLNTINGGAHRFVAGGTNDVMAVSDFAKALYSLKKANVPATNLVAIVDPSVEYTMNTLTNLVNVSNNPMFEGLITSGIGTGMKFTKNIYGFDVYTSNYLVTGISETVNGNAITNGAANLMFSAAGDVLPFIGAWRQMPTVDSEYNKDHQREEHVTTARYGVKLYRRENLVVVLSDTSNAISF
jgi:hypothetical protein